MSRALVLSGGGSVGIGWQTGLAGGLASRGVDLHQAEYIVGTSAGSAVGARIALGRDMEEATERYRELARAAAAGQPVAVNPGFDMERLHEIIKLVLDAAASPGPPEETRAAMGKIALDAETMSEDDFLLRFADLAGAPFPDGYACTTIDALTGEFVVWDAASAVPLDRAVASSCSVPGLFPPVTINGRRYIDGGARSGTNADLAEGHDTVLIVTLTSAERLRGSEYEDRAVLTREQLDRESAILVDGGASLEVIGPDDEAVAVMGVNLMDAQIAPAAAEAGFRQGQAIAGGLGEFWS